MTTAQDESHVVSSGNVFSDLGLPQSEELLAKAALASQICEIARSRRLTQSETARIIGATQPKVSELFAGRLAGFSMGRLMRYLNALDRDVRITVQPKPADRACATIKVTGQIAP